VGDTSSLGDTSDVVFQEWLYVINSSKENVEFNLPLLLNTDDWQCVLNTAHSDVAQYNSEKVSPLLMMESRSFLFVKA